VRTTSHDCRRFAVVALLALVFAMAWVATGHAQQPAFGSKVDIATGVAPVAVARGDLNKDGKLDLVVANTDDDSISVFLGDGTGGFVKAAGSPFATDLGPFALALGDLNGDGKLDLVVVNSIGDSISIFLGDGLGGFAEAAGSPFGTGQSPAALALGDVNRDGKLDVIVVNSSDDTVSVFLGNGLGGFSTKTDFPTGPAGGFPAALALVDVNGDFFLDLVIANGLTETVSVLRGDGTGHFTQVPGSPFPTGAGGGSAPSAIAAADLNGDGKVDVVLANILGDTISVMLGAGDGTFVAPGGGATFMFATGAAPSAVALADVNGDGKLDAIVTNMLSSSVSVFPGDGLGGFGARVDFATGGGAVGTGAVAVAVGDVNGDGRLDLVVANDRDNSVSVLVNTTLIAQLKAVLTGPTPGSVLPGAAPITFTWSPAGAGSSGYQIWMGTKPGGYDLYTSGIVTGLSVTDNKTPPTGSTPVYVRLYTRFGTAWPYNDYTFTAAAAKPAQFALSVVAAGNGSGTASPVAVGGSTLVASGASVTLTATAGVGSAFTGWSGGGCSGTGTCTVTVTAATTVTATFTSLKAVLTTPAPGGVLPGAAPITFAWSAGGTGSSGYQIWMGTTLGGYDLYTSGILTGLSVIDNKTPPTGGSPVYLRLFTRFGTAWVYNDYTFTSAAAKPSQFPLSVAGAGTGSGTVSPVAVGGSTLVSSGTSVTLTATPALGSEFTGWSGGGCSGSGTCTVTVTAATTVTATFTSLKAVLTGPAPGSVLPGTAPITFAWSAGGTGSSGYQVYVGTTRGGFDLYTSGIVTGLSVIDNKTPPTGSIPVYLRLFTRFGTTWLYNDYTFTSAP
jgi:VCBS repeat protein/List-Bact-rpt repeat protein/FG-GAP repeat protein